MAVPTPATDGKRVYALFGTGDLVCVDSAGKPVWLRSPAQEYGVFRNRWGMAASPLLLEGLLVVQVDHWGGSYLLGVDPATGANRWRTPRAASVNWTSPVAVRVGGTTQVVTAGTRALKGYSAQTGKELWSLGGLHVQCIPTPVARGDRLYVACGARFTTLCVGLKAGKGGRTEARVRWKEPNKGVGVPSPLLLGEYLYYAEDAGWASCRRADTGAAVWRRRLGGRVQASPVAGAGKLYFPCANGVVSVLRAGPRYELLARNDLGEGVVASPALSQGRLFLRGEKHLFCIAGK
jgi:outer membrane protein assembly factor BamB